MSLALQLLLGSLAGGLGAALRYVLDFWITARAAGDFPWGIGVVNVSGSLAAGLLLGLAARHEVSEVLLFVGGGGFLGAYTTFSTWAFQSVELIRAGRWGLGAAYLGGSVGLGVLGAAAGHALATAW